MRYLGRALDFHSYRYFHLPSAVKVIHVSRSEKETCLWLPTAMPLGCWIWKYSRRLSGQEGPKVVPSLRGGLCYLSINSYNGTSISEAVPSVDKYSGKRYPECFCH